MSSFLSAAAYSAVGKKSRDAMRRYQIQAISGTTMCWLQYQRRLLLTLGYCP